MGNLSPFARLLFAGLWCWADREGRLEDRPLRIKAEILPYDDVDIENLLQQLHEAEFIQRYEVNGNRYIQIVNFRKHQHPHINEQPSEIPPPLEHQSSTVLVSEMHHTSTVVKPEMHDTSTKQVSDKNDASTSCYLLLDNNISSSTVKPKSRRQTLENAAIVAAAVAVEKDDGGDEIEKIYGRLMDDIVTEWNRLDPVTGRGFAAASTRRRKEVAAAILAGVTPKDFLELLKELAPQGIPPWQIRQEAVKRYGKTRDSPLRPAHPVQHVPRSGVIIGGVPVDEDEIYGKPLFPEVKEAGSDSS